MANLVKVQNQKVYICLNHKNIEAEKTGDKAAKWSCSTSLRHSALPVPGGPRGWHWWVKHLSPDDGMCIWAARQIMSCSSTSALAVKQEQHYSSDSLWSWVRSARVFSFLAGVTCGFMLIIKGPYHIHSSLFVSFFLNNSWSVISTYSWTSVLVWMK